MMYILDDSLAATTKSESDNHFAVIEHWHCNPVEKENNNGTSSPTSVMIGGCNTTDGGESLSGIVQEEFSTTTMAEENEDWTATSIIYEGTTKSVQIIPQGFVGSIEIPISVLDKIAFFRRVSKEGHFRYFCSASGSTGTAGASAILHLEFVYKYESNLSSGEGEEELQEDYPSPSPLPSSVRLKLKQGSNKASDVVFPLADQADAFLQVLTKECNRRLVEDDYPSSFAICEYCEHEALREFLKEQLFYQISDFQLYQLPDQMDHLYHYNHGQLIHPKELARQARALRTKNKKKGNTQQPQKETEHPASPPPKTLEDFAKSTLMERWEYLYTTSCPICMDDMKYSEGVTLPSCQHFVCTDCFDLYLKFKVKDELFQSNSNPFCCPIETCRHALPIKGFVESFLEPQDNERVQKWYKDLQFPPCFSLDQCLSPSCRAANSMRRKPNKSCKDTDVYCDVCEKMWCEWCLKRLYYKENDNKKRAHHKDHLECDPTMAVMFCQRYLAASEQKQQACRERYPWIASYAHSRDLDMEANKWIMENGQICPSCSTGVERSEGCFHMKCVVCETHFCYECGDQLFPPYYGTHHCWEQNQLELR